MRHAVLALVMLHVWACKPVSESASSGEKTVVARVGEAVITTDDIQAVLRPYVQAPLLLAHQNPRQILEDLIQLELLAAEARRRGYDRDPDVQRAVKQRLAREFERKELVEKVKAEHIPDAEIAKYYKEHRREFVRSDEVRVSEIVVKERATALKIRATLAKAKDDGKAFRELGAKHAINQDSGLLGGSFLVSDAETQPRPKAIVAAAFALRKEGDLSEPVQSEKGFHILRLVHRRPGFTRPLSDAKPLIANRLVDQRRAKKRTDIIEELRKTRKVEIHEDKLGPH